MEYLVGLVKERDVGLLSVVGCVDLSVDSVSPLAGRRAGLVLIFVWFFVFCCVVQCVDL